MKKILFIILLIFAGSMPLSAQYQMILENAVQPNSTTFKFDIYIVSTATDFNLTSYGIKLILNSTIVNGGNITFSYIPSSSSMSITPLSVTTSASGGAVNLQAASNAGSQTVSTTPLKMGTFQIVNSVAFGASPIAMTWSFTNPFPTMVNINNAVSTVPANHINALSPYIMTLENDVQVSSNTYEFDVYIASTSVNFSLTSYQVCLSYNQSVSNGGSLTFSYIASTTQLTSATPFISPVTPSGIISDGGTPNFICGSTAGNQTVSTAPLKIGRFRITNTVDFAIAPLNVVWDFTGSYVTQVNINSTNVTLQANHTSTLGNTPLPVELVSFTAKEDESGIKLSWSTATELNNYGFEVQKKASDWEKIGFVKGTGNSNSPKEYTFTDKNLTGGTEFRYRLKQIDFSGKSKYFDPVSLELAVPKEFKLMQNSPNPFNPSTAIKFQLPLNSFVTVKIYDQLGREIRSLLSEERQSGAHIVYWNGRDNSGQMVSSGIYLYRLQAGSFVETHKMNLLK